ncbi:lysyl-tRNA synthetase [Streptococcus pneumoniae]|uniref:lysyl-tRNA synthetase n=1 Tax=Streptococcus pneumoniae TaxID=1313 RepID=UPI000B595A03|nr:lysyl-tRNA synthetase [Streptococcus pneumoniae]
MRIKEQTRKLAAGCSKHCFEVVGGVERGLKRFSKSMTSLQAGLCALFTVSSTS